MVAKGHDHPEEIVEMGVAFVIGDAFGFYDEQALEGMYYFLNLFPLVRVLLDLAGVALDDLVYAFVFLYED